MAGPGGKKWLRRGGWVLGALVLLLAGLVVVGFDDVPIPERGRFAIDLAALRAFAGPEETLPEKARAELVAEGAFPEFFAIARGGLHKVPFGFYAWQFVYQDGTSALIDAVYPKKMHHEGFGKSAPYHDDGWERQERAVATASVVAVTHEHADHLGGISESAHFNELGRRLKLTATQRQLPPAGGIPRTLGGEPTLESGEEGSLHKIAPGIVAISAPGHTPGTQMVYVRMKDQREFLLVGDVAWQGTYFERMRQRPKLVTWLMGEDSPAVANQLRAVIDLKQAQPSLDVVVAHDVGQMEKRFSAGTVIKGLL
jgi:glyoxylase-like metal-dependent hydrolase (beta-lactamase superfamily II)